MLIAEYAIVTSKWKRAVFLINEAIHLYFFFGFGAALLMGFFFVILQPSLQLGYMNMRY
jgi:hypothetical protein